MINYRPKFLFTVMLCIILLVTSMFSVQAASTDNLKRIAVITDARVIKSGTADANVKALNDTKAELNAEFTVPGDRAVFEINIKNMSDIPARLSKIERNIMLSENIHLSCDFLPSKSKNLLESGEECTVQITAEFNPDYDKKSIDESANFTLNFVFESILPSGSSSGTTSDLQVNSKDNNSVKTATSISFAVVFALICAGIILVVSLYQQRNSKERED